MSEKFEYNPEQQEKSKPATIRLEFFRHDDKGSNLSALPDEELDKIIPLSEGGRIHASEIGKEKNPHPEVGIVIGSPRDRTIETGLRQLLANEEAVTPQHSLADIKELIEDQLEISKKHKATELLDFNHQGSENFRREANEHFNNDKDLLVWYLEESDQLAQREKDQISTSYSRLAGNVAKLVLKYVDGHSVWKKIVSENPDKYSKFDNELQRFMSTHLGVSEAFLMKIIEKTKGKDEVYNFLNTLKTKNGFGYGEGYSLVINDLDLQEEASAQQIIINYKDQQLIFGEDIIKEIIADSEELNKKIEGNKKQFI